MIISKEYIKKVSLFDYKGQIQVGRINKSILDLTELKVKSRLDCRIVSFLTIELLQHFSRLSEYREPFNNFEYVLGKDNDKYYIYFSKIVLNKNLGFIDDLKLVNESNLQELKELFKEIMRSGGVFFGNSPLKSLFLIELKRKSREDIILSHKSYDNENSTIELIISTKIGQILKNKLVRFFQQNHKLTESTLTWHKEKNYRFENHIKDVLEELSNHPELNIEKKAELLINEEFLLTYDIRKNGIETIPEEWINPTTFEVDKNKLDEIWLRPIKGYLYRHLSNSTNEKDKKKLQKLKESKGFKSRGTKLTEGKRKQKRLDKLQIAINKNKTIILLGMHTAEHFELKKKIKKHETNLQYVSDHVWSSLGYTEPGVKVSDSRLSILQAAETIRRMPELGLKGSAIEKREIAFSLDGYDAKRALAAMYSNPNRIERNYKKPVIKGLEKFEFAFTGLTDLELANIVRNKEWFDLLTFCRTGDDGRPEKLTKKQVAEEYGIKYIGDLMVERIKIKTDNNA